MSEAVKRYLSECRQIAQAEKAAKRAQVLIRCGLCERQYAPPSQQEYTEEYPEYEWDLSTQQARFYRLVPLQVTDEEYEEILKYAVNRNRAGKNKIAAATKVIAITSAILGFFGFLIAGFIIFGAAANVDYSIERDALNNTAVWTILGGWSSTAFLAWMTYAFGELIERVSSINQKLK